MWFYVLSGVLFILAQLACFLLIKIICQVCSPSFVVPLIVLTRVNIYSSGYVGEGGRFILGDSSTERVHWHVVFGVAEHY